MKSFLYENLVLDRKEQTYIYRLKLHFLVQSKIEWKRSFKIAFLLAYYV